MSEDVIKNSNPRNPERRQFLGKITGVVAGTGVAAACWPFLRSMYPAADVRDNSTTVVRLDNIDRGQMKTVEWQGKPVFVLHRTDEQISRMRKSAGGKDPESDNDRVKQDDWLVVVGLCTHLGCVPARHNKGWSCPCHGSEFDNSGRVLKGPAPTNLAVPEYRIGAGKIIIG